MPFLPISRQSEQGERRWLKMAACPTPETLKSVERESPNLLAEAFQSTVSVSLTWGNGREWVMVKCHRLLLFLRFSSFSWIIVSFLLYDLRKFINTLNRCFCLFYLEIFLFVSVTVFICYGFFAGKMVYNDFKPPFQSKIPILVA